MERSLFHARYVEGWHSATRIHPELQDLKVGDLVYYGGWCVRRVDAIEACSHLVAGETWLLRPLPGDRTRNDRPVSGYGVHRPGAERDGS